MRKVKQVKTSEQIKQELAKIRKQIVLQGGANWYKAIKERI